MAFPGLQRFVLSDVAATGKNLGAGSYGSVVELKVNGLVCAGKRLHDALLDRDNTGVANIERRYLEECQVMAELRHPHIVQFLGLCFLEGSALPVLVMERLDSNLDELLEGLPGLPLALKRSLLADVARGLLYLHTHNPPVVHRDLSARNVLLTSSQVAKISDLGNARIVNLRPNQVRNLTPLPGTMVYMPPEAFDERSQYGPRLDIFSFGHLTLFTLTQEHGYPPSACLMQYGAEPDSCKCEGLIPKFLAKCEGLVPKTFASVSNQFRELVFPGTLLPHTYPDPQNRDHLLARSEVDRRRNYIQQLHGQLGEEHPLVQVVHQCLHNTPNQRPSAEEVLQQLEAVRAQTEGPYGQSMRVIVDMEKVRVLREKDAENERLRQQVRQLQEEVESKDTQLQQKDEELLQKERQLQEMDRQLRGTTPSTSEQQTAIADQTAEGKGDKDLQSQIQQLQAAMDKRIHFFEQQLLESRFETNRLWKVLRYQTTSSDESTAEVKSPLPQKSQRASSSGLLLSLPLKWRSCRDMLFATSDSHAVILQKKVYIGGGWANDDVDDCTIQVYDMEIEEWSRLPKYQFKWFGMTVINSHLTVVGGWDRSLGKVTNQLAVFDPTSQNWTRPYPPMPTPRHRPAASAYNEWLLAAGGYDGGRILVTVELLNTSTNQWLTASPLPALCRNLTSTIDHETSVWYLVAYNKQVFYVSLPDIVQQTVSQSTDSEPPSLWRQLPDTPLGFSAATTVRGSLLTLGGNDSGTSSTAIYLYQPESRRWNRVGDLPAAREYCSCIPLSSSELLVAGGEESYGGYFSRVDVATL